MSPGRGRDEKGIHARSKAVGVCPECRKRVYPTKQVARSTARQMGLRDRGTVYRAHGGLWHITSHPQTEAS